MKHKIENSSNIEFIDYDPTEKILKVEFKSGAEYWYQPVTATQHTLLMNSESKGSALQEIKQNKNVFVTKRGGGTRTSILQKSETVEKSELPSNSQVEDLLQMSMNFHQLKSE